MPWVGYVENMVSIYKTTCHYGLIFSMKMEAGCFFKILVSIYKNVTSRDSAVGIATGYGLDDQGVGGRVLWGQEISLLHVVQTSSGPHPISCPVGTEDSFLGGKAAEAWSWPLTPN
jgi:hypothetical protein